MTDLRRARADLATFARAIEQPLTDWQAESLALERRTTALVAPRQSGKSRSLSVLALWWAYARREQRVLVISAGEDASRRLLAQAAEVATRSPLLVGSVVDENSGLLALSNGSEIRSVPASERAVRGWTVDLLLVDEAAQVDDDLLLGAALPTTAARPDARIVLAGSPGAPEGAFYDFARRGDEDGAEYVATHRWALTDATWIEPEVVASAEQSLAPAAFRREYLGEFADVGADERVIAREWIAEAQQRALEERDEPIFAVDVARRLNLRWSDVHLASGRLRVRAGKTAAAERTVDLLPLLRDELAALAAAVRGEGDAFVFATSTGGRQQASNLRRRVLAPAVEAANEALVERDAEPLPEGLTPHSLRRTFASLLYALGESPPYVMAQMGHTSPNLALAIYARAMDRRDGEPEKLAALVGRPYRALTGNRASEPAATEPAESSVAA
ncbi:MAG TPA: tyrosine-type recombinase/integrase [Solirubrobacteraceae bacterium]|jgi:hypothetical protein|nr:tyrosine-type recombinase/integrase [Solirubrobacteraceae bacterium]